MEGESLDSFEQRHLTHVIARMDRDANQEVGGFFVAFGLVGRALAIGSGGFKPFQKSLSQGLPLRWVGNAPVVLPILHSAFSFASREPLEPDVLPEHRVS